MLKKFRNRSEHRVQQQIRSVIDRHDAELHEKVRIADIVDISKLNQRALGTYALQAHFDFVFIDQDLNAIFVLEFDGLGHDATNDAKKNSVCRQAGLPLFRIFGFQEVREINAMTLTRYLVELVFHAREFQKMKAEGQIAPTEPFMLSGFLKADAKNIYDSDFNFVGNTNSKLTRALKQHKLAEEKFPHMSISRLVARSQSDELRAFISINSLKGPIMGSANVRISLPSSGFLAEISTVPIEIAQFADGMASDALYENLGLIGSGAGHVVTATDELLAEVSRLSCQGYSLAFGCCGSQSDVDLLAIFSGGNGKN